MTFLRMGKVPHVRAGERKRSRSGARLGRVLSGVFRTRLRGSDQDLLTAGACVPLRVCAAFAEKQNGERGRRSGQRIKTNKKWERNV